VKVNIKKFLESSPIEPYRSTPGPSSGLAFALYLIFLVLFLAYRNMPLGCEFGKLPPAPLALDPIIRRLVCLCGSSPDTAPTAACPRGAVLVDSSCSHGCSEHFALGFPFGCLRLLCGEWLLVLGHCLALGFITWELLFRWWRLVTKVIFIIILNLSLFLDIKNFPLLNEHFLAYLGMLLKSLLVEFPPTCWTLYPFTARIIILLLIVILNCSSLVDIIILR
jgi:hypothetical protein